MRPQAMSDPLVSDGPPLEVPQDDCAVIGCGREKRAAREDNEVREETTLVTFPRSRTGPAFCRDCHIAVSVSAFRSNEVATDLILSAFLVRTTGGIPWIRRESRSHPGSFFGALARAIQLSGVR